MQIETVSDLAEQIADWIAFMGMQKFMCIR